MILGHHELKRLINEIKLVENADLENVQGAGIDIRAAQFYRLQTPAKLGVVERILPEMKEITDEQVFVKPNEYIMIQTMEKVNMPLNLAARMLPRSTLQRSGIYLYHALIDPGYHGKLTFGMKNIGHHDFEIERGSRIAQIMFEEVHGKTEAYDGRYQGGKIV